MEPKTCFNVIYLVVAIAIIGCGGCGMPGLVAVRDAFITDLINASGWQ